MVKDAAAHALCDHSLGAPHLHQLAHISLQAGLAIQHPQQAPRHVCCLQALEHNGRKQDAKDFFATPG